MDVNPLVDKNVTCIATLHCVVEGWYTLYTLIGVSEVQYKGSCVPHGRNVLLTRKAGRPRSSHTVDNAKIIVVLGAMSGGAKGISSFKTSTKFYVFRKRISLVSNGS